MTDQERLCQICLRPTDADDSFEVNAFALTHAVGEEDARIMEKRWNAEGLPDHPFAHTACITEPQLLDWPRQTPFQAWATARIRQLESMTVQQENPSP